MAARKSTPKKAPAKAPAKEPAVRRSSGTSPPALPDAQPQLPAVASAPITPVLSAMVASARGPTPLSADEPTVELDITPLPVTRMPPPVEVTFAPRGQDGVAQIDRALARIPAGGRLRVHYLRDLADLDQRGTLVRVEMGWLLPGSTTAGMTVVADGQRSAQGHLVRRAPVLDVPREARGELQLWFRLVAQDGRETWDSMYSYNHRFRVEAPLE